MKMTRPVSPYSAEQLIDALTQAREQLRALMACLPAEHLVGPCEEYLNPPLWEVGHIVWFQERWCLREQPDGRLLDSLLAGADALYDSSAVAHETRWNLPLLPPAAWDDYGQQVASAVTARLRNAFNPELAYFAELSLLHELMHIEAWWMAFQNLGLAPPANLATPAALPAPHPGRLLLSEGAVTLGSGENEGFIFDNEKWRHTVLVPAFDIDAALVSETTFAAFVDAGGYLDSAGWSESGWVWRMNSGATHPVYWRKLDGQWRVRRFKHESPLRADVPMCHINQFEAEACAAWLGRRLPTAGQWLRATALPDFSWGHDWEWLGESFAPYPGFSADPYTDYSEPWFHSHAELRGAGPYTNALLKRPGFRNFYLPHRRDVFAGFRTVSRDT